MMRVVRLKACTLLCWLLVLNAATPAFSNKNNIIRTRESDRKLKSKGSTKIAKKGPATGSSKGPATGAAAVAAKGPAKRGNRRKSPAPTDGPTEGPTLTPTDGPDSSKEAAELVASIKGIVHEMKTQPDKRAEELGLEGKLTKFASEVKTKEIARFEKEATSPKTTNVKQLAENFHAEADETDKQILQMIGQKQAQLADELGTMAKGIEVAETLVRSRAAEYADLEAKTEQALSDADHLVFDFKRQQKALTKKFSAPVCCAVEVDDAEPTPIQRNKIIEVISSALHIEMNRIALQHGFDVLVNGTSGIEIVTTSDSQNKGTLLKFKVEQQLSCSTNCKPHNIYNDEGRLFLLQNEEIQKTLKKRVQEYTKYELEDKSEVDCSSCGAWNWETSDFSSHVSPEDYEDVQEFVHAESLLLEQESQRDTELNERLAHCDYKLDASQKSAEDVYLSCIASVDAVIAKMKTSNKWRKEKEKRNKRNECKKKVQNIYPTARTSYGNCVEKANFVYSSTQSSLINTYEDIEREVSKGTPKIFSSSSMMSNQLVDRANKKKAELIEVLLFMTRVVEENIVCDISGATDETPSIEDIDQMSTHFEFLLNRAYHRLGQNNRVVAFSFYESCLLDAETLESLECVDQSNRQLKLKRKSRFTRRLRGNGNNQRANAARSKNILSNYRSLTSIQEDPTHDAMEPNHKHVEVHRRAENFDQDAFIQYVSIRFGKLYMKFYDHLIEDNKEFSVHCSLGNEMILREGGAYKYAYDNTL
eukprot:scaffold18872_cov53-Attheya_sp.AAC.2